MTRKGIQMARKYWAGLDVGVEATCVCVIDDSGAIIHEGNCSTDVKAVSREIAFLKRRRFARVGLESGVGMSLARGLRNLGYSVDVYETRQLSKFLRMRRNKTDAGDASGIAQAGRLGAGTISKVHLKSLECQSLQSRLTIRRRLIRNRISAVNTLCRQLEQFGGRVRPCAGSVLRDKVESELEKIFGGAQDAVVSELRRLVDQCEQLILCQQESDRELKRLALQHNVCRRLMDIPGVGPICSLTFYAAVGDPHRFRRSADIGSYFGLTPKLHQSGLTHRMGRISKMGNKGVRSLLFRASTLFMRFAGSDSELAAWAYQIEQRRGRRRARVALARKLATIMISLWKSGQSFEAKTIKAPTQPQP